jgi:DNA polymerase elongation subunit (family B)
MKFYTDAYLQNNIIYLRGRENGKRVSRRIVYKPYLFVPSKRDEPEYRSIYGQSVDKIEFDTVTEARKFIHSYEDVSNFEIFGFSIHKFGYTFLNDYYPGTIDYDPDKLNIGIFDIEVGADEGFPDVYLANKPITAITIKMRDIIVAFGCGDYIAPKGVIYLKFDSEEELLKKFVEVWGQMDLDIISGWNVELFDIPYIINRIAKLIGQKYVDKLSPWGRIEERDVQVFNETKKTYIIRGICVLDYLNLYKKFTYSNQESYKLDHIAFVELGEKKLDYSEYAGLQDLYRRDFQKFMDYNIHDVLLVQRIDDKMNLISLAIAVAYDAKINFSDVFSPIRLWDTVIHNNLLESNIVVSRETEKQKSEKFIGAYVKDPILGLHRYVASFDVEGLYPSLIVQYNISPETYCGKIDQKFSIEDLLGGALNNPKIQEFLKEKNYALTANGCLWDRSTEGVFPRLIVRMMAERKQYKKLMLDAQREYEKNPSNELKNTISKYNNLQMARKILLNSLYGALGNKYFRWFEIEFAEAVTTTGQLAIRWIEQNVNSFVNKLCGENKDRVIAIDTDSVYLNMEDLVTKTQENPIDYMDKVCEQIITPKIASSFDSLVAYTNAYTPFLKMKREALADKGIWTAKKRYILNVHDNEGVRYTEPKLKMMGIEAVKSSTPAACRDKIKQALKIIMNGTEDDVIGFIAKFREEFIALPFEDIAFPRGCNGITEYSDKDTIYKKGTPIHVRGALVYNNAIRNANLDNKYELVRDGEKIKFCYMRLPNTIRENVISITNVLPKELDLKKYIDYDVQFEKSFVEPLKIILDSIGYAVERRSTLAKFLI